MQGSKIFTTSKEMSIPSTYLTEQEIAELRNNFPGVTFAETTRTLQGADSGSRGPVAASPRTYVFPSCSARRSKTELLFNVAIMHTWKLLSLQIQNLKIINGRLHGEAEGSYQTLRVYLDEQRNTKKQHTIVEVLWTKIKELAEAGLYHAGINTDNTFVQSDANGALTVKFAGFASYNTKRLSMWSLPAGLKKSDFTSYLALIMTGLLTRVWRSGSGMKDKLERKACDSVRPTKEHYEVVVQKLIRARLWAVDWEVWGGLVGMGEKQTIHARWIERIENIPMPQFDSISRSATTRTAPSIRSFGITNPNSQCWANASLQMLYRDACVRDALKGKQAMQLPQELEDLGQIFVEFDRHERGVVDVSSYTKRLQAAFFRHEHHEEDAHEFLLYVYELLRERGFNTYGDVCMFKTEKNATQTTTNIKRKVEFHGGMQLSPPQMKDSGKFDMEDLLRHYTEEETIERRPEGVISAKHSYRLVFDERVYLHVATVVQKGRTGAFEPRGLLRVRKTIEISDYTFELESVIMRPPGHFVFYDFDTKKLYNDGQVTNHEWSLDDENHDVHVNFGSKLSLGQHGIVFLYRRGIHVGHA
jgi:hypothetical protein